MKQYCRALLLVMALTSCVKKEVWKGTYQSVTCPEMQVELTLKGSHDGTYELLQTCTSDDQTTVEKGDWKKNTDMEFHLIDTVNRYKRLYRLKPNGDLVELDKQMREVSSCVLRKDE